MDAVVREWLVQAMQDQRHAAQFRMEAQVDHCQGLFYADDGKITSHDAKWLQTLIDILTGLFLRVGFCTNITKTKTMICVPGGIQMLISEAAYKHQSTDQGDSHYQWKQHCISCPECDKDLAAGSLQQHL